MPTWTVGEVWLVAVLVAMTAGSIGLFAGALMSLAGKDAEEEKRRQRAWRDYE